MTMLGRRSAAKLHSLLSRPVEAGDAGDAGEERRKIEETLAALLQNIKISSQSELGAARNEEKCQALI